mmetsp:Transcript_10006/g.11952  ORF Transcript_10006/g.11952 Transcript_10006/m.11952 type:complete len:102 (-) Transcript_10006:93-398(-)
MLRRRCARIQHMLHSELVSSRRRQPMKLNCRSFSVANSRPTRTNGNYAIGAGLIMFVSAVYYRSISAVSKNDEAMKEIEAVQKELDEEQAIQKEIEAQKRK